MISFEFATKTFGGVGYNISMATFAQELDCLFSSPGLDGVEQTSSELEYFLTSIDRRSRFWIG